MKKSTLFFGLVLGIIVFARMVAADEKKISDYKTAQECYDAAMKIDSAGTSEVDQMAVWGRKFALLGQAIKLDPKFTQAYVPYVQTYFEQPMGHEYTDSEELDRLTALLKKGLEYHPPNGDEFLWELVNLEHKRWGYTKDSLNRIIYYLTKALNEYPESKLTNNVRLSLFSHFEILENPESGIPYLKMIVESDGSDENVTLALEYLIHYYNQINDYPNLLKYSNSYIDKFGYKSAWYTYALYCKALSCSKLKLYNELIITCSRYFSEENKINRRHASTDKVMYRFLSEAYSANSDVELSTKYRKLSE